MVVDREQCVVRIVGSDAREVSRARAMLELSHCTVRAADDRTRRGLIGKGGKTITDVQRRSGAISIDVDHDQGVVRIVGTASATAAAALLIQSFIGEA